MPSVQQLVEIIAHRTGIPATRCRTVARRLIEAGILPIAAGAHIPSVSLANVADLLLPILAGAKIQDAAETVKLYRDLVPHGVDTDVMPEHIRPPRASAGDLFDNVVHTFANGHPDDQAVASKFRIEVVRNWPEVRLYHNADDATGSPFAQPGTLTSHWQSGQIRTATIIPGTTLAAIVADVKAAR